MDCTKLTVAELANAMITTETAIRWCREILDDLQEPKTVGMQAVVKAIRDLLPKLGEDLKALSNTASPLQATVWFLVKHPRTNQSGYSGDYAATALPRAVRARNRGTIW
jgi:hypothetical protein